MTNTIDISKILSLALAIGISFAALGSSSIVSVGENSGLKIKPPQEGTFHSAFLATAEEIDSSSQLLAKINDFELASKRKLQFVATQQSWLNGIEFPSLEAKTIYDSGRIPIVRIVPVSLDQQYTGKIDPIYDLRKIARGDFDQEIKAMLREAGSLKGKDGKLIPIFLVFGPEVNGYWNSYSGIHYGGGVTDRWGDPNYPDGPEIFRDAYRKIISLSKTPSINVNNVTWAIHFDVQGMPNVEWNLMEKYYPGDDYIDWIGLSVLSAQTREELAWYDSFEDFVFNKTVVYETRWEEFLAVSDKPKALLEYGVIEDPSNPERKATWIREAIETIENKCPEFKIASYWNEAFFIDDYFSDIRITSSVNAENAYRTSINKEHFSAKFLID